MPRQCTRHRRKYPPVIPEAEPQARSIRDLPEQSRTSSPRSRLEALLAYGSHRFVRDDGCGDGLALHLAHGLAGVAPLGPGREDQQVGGRLPLRIARHIELGVRLALLHLDEQELVTGVAAAPAGACARARPDRCARGRCPRSGWRTRGRFCSSQQGIRKMRVTVALRRGHAVDRLGRQHAAMAVGQLLAQRIEQRRRHRVVEPKAGALLRRHHRQAAARDRPYPVARRVASDRSAAWPPRRPRTAACRSAAGGQPVLSHSRSRNRSSTRCRRQRRRGP